MPSRAVVSKQLASLLSVLAHPGRIRIVEELRTGEKDVNSLQSVLGTSHSAVSQQLGILRAHGIVAERRAGRHVFYHLQDPRLAAWLADGLAFLKTVDRAQEVSQAVEQVRALWADQTEALKAGQD